MAQGAGLTARQEQLLDVLIREPYILKTFYFSGGTALSYWYLHHRQSDDLDFFSLVPFDYDRIARCFRKNKEDIEYSDIRFDEDYGFLMVYLQYPDKSFLKTDFHYYSKEKISQGIRWRGLEIDSLMDITVNKLRTISTFPRTRDYIDFYCIMQKEPWLLDDLIIKSKKKFHESIDVLQLAKNFLKVREYRDYPKMLIPFQEKEMEFYYENLVKILKPKILK